MKAFCYFGFADRQLKAYREDGETVFSAKTSKPIAFINEGTWFDWATHKPVAIEEDKVVYDWATHKPILVISIE